MGSGRLDRSKFKYHVSEIANLNFSPLRITMAIPAADEIKKSQAESCQRDVKKSWKRNPQEKFQW